MLDEAPARPSSLVDDPQLRRRLRGDLDAIVLKALDKDPDGRYLSVQALADDLRAHLAGRPVAARAPRPGYLAARFVRRHRWPVAAAVLAALSLVVGLASTLWQMQQADAARRLAEQRLPMCASWPTAWSSATTTRSAHLPRLDPGARPTCWPMRSATSTA